MEKLISGWVEKSKHPNKQQLANVFAVVFTLLAAVAFGYLSNGRSNHQISRITKPVSSLTSLAVVQHATENITVSQDPPVKSVSSAAVAPPEREAVSNQGTARANAYPRPISCNSTNCMPAGVNFNAELSINPSHLAYSVTGTSPNQTIYVNAATNTAVNNPVVIGLPSSFSYTIAPANYCDVLNTWCAGWNIQILQYNVGDMPLGEYSLKITASDSQGHTYSGAASLTITN